MQRKKAELAATYAVLGGTALLLLAFFEVFPSFTVWLLFAAAFVFLEWRSVEVNDRMYASPSVMVAMTAAVAFGPGSAALGIAAMAGAALLTPDDLRERRWFQPLANFGQLTVSAAVAGLVLEALLPDFPASDWTVAEFSLAALASAVAAVVYSAVNVTMVTYAVRRVFNRRDVRPWAHMSELVPSMLVMGFLGGLLGATYHQVPEILPLIFGVYMLGYLAFSSYSRLREAHEATLRGFIKALEAKDLYARGHTERVAYFTELTGSKLGYRGAGLQRLRWAALIHDVGKLAVSRDVISRIDELPAPEQERIRGEMARMVALLREVTFLAPVVELASHEAVGVHSDARIQPREAQILAVADAFDFMTSTRTAAVSFSQDAAFTALRRDVGGRYDDDVVEAFIAAIEETGERYGNPATVEPSAADEPLLEQEPHRGW